MGKVKQENTSIYGQAEYHVRFEWGLPGLEALAPISDAVVIVDVLSFTTCVTIAVEVGASVIPYGSNDKTVEDVARMNNAQLAVARRDASLEHPYSLSPASMFGLEAGQRIVLASPNGSTLSLAAASSGRTILAGCLRNAAAVAETATRVGHTVAVIAAGEQWPNANKLRPAVEDLVGAGAIIDHLPGSRSPEAETSFAAFLRARSRLPEFLLETVSGRQLADMAYGDDVTLCSELNISTAVAVMHDKAYVRMANSD